jgi:small GTP-binding protein
MNNYFKYDIFLSYSHLDSAIVLELAQKLKDDGLTIWFDQWEIKKGENIEREIREGLNSARTLVLVMSKNTFGTDWVSLERQTVPFRDPTNIHKKFIPLIIRKCEIKDTLKQYAFIDYRRKSSKEYNKLLQACRPKKSSKVGIKEKKTELKSVKIFKGHTELIRRVAITPDGKYAVSASNDKTIRLWDLEKEVCSATITGHKNAIWATSITVDGKKIISGSHDNTIRIWDAKIGKCLHIFDEPSAFTCDIAITPNGLIAASSHDFGHINVWDLKKWEKIITLKTEPSKIWAIAISEDGKKVFSGSNNNTIDIWDVKTGQNINTLVGHSGGVQGLSVSKDGTKIISGSSDSTIRIWDTDSGRCLASLEGHTGKVWSVAITEDGKKIVSGSGDKTIRVWDVETGRCLNVFEGHFDSVYSIAISADGSRIVSASKDMTVRVWNLIKNKKSKSKIDGTIRYTNAKVLLVGDTGVGKSGLAIRLTENRFENTISTDAVWATQLKLPQNSDNLNIEREIWLWDFAGQPDYRLVHQLFMDETSLAILVFNPQNDNPFEGLSQWTYELQRAARRPFKKILVAGRCDRGNLIVSRKSIENFHLQNDFSGYYETSANTGLGCTELYNAIISGIDWNNIPWTASPRIFKLLKKEIVNLKDEGKVLLRLSELKQQLEMRLPNDSFSMEELLAVIGLLAGPGVLWHLGFGDFVLLKPERINAYAAAVIRKVRLHPEELGIIPEEDALAGRLDYQDMKRLPFDDEQIILRAMHQTFIDNGICLREQTEAGTLLVFPSYFKRERPVLFKHPSVFVTYYFNGNLDDIYSTLIVRLHHTTAFQKDKLWKFAADFKTEGGKTIGIKMTKKNDGNGEIDIYFEPQISDDTKVTFIRYVHEHLKIKTLDIVRLRHYVCPFCETPVENRKTASDRLKNGKKDIVCVNCEKRIPLMDLIEEKFASEHMQEEVFKLSKRAGISIDNESKELILIGHAFAIAGEAGQIFRPTSNSDWGIDGEIEFKNTKGEASGKRLYLQLKSGDSYLRTRKSDEKEIFTINNPRHSTYWKSQAYPVMLVIRNSENQIRWMNITKYLKNKKKDKRTIIFEGEPFSALSLVKIRDEVLGISD